jgi:hypothetical protein
MRSFRLLRRPAAPSAFAFGLGVDPDDPPPLDCIFRWHNEASDTTLVQFKINLYAKELTSQVAPRALDHGGFPANVVTTPSWGFLERCFWSGCLETVV